MKIIGYGKPSLELQALEFLYNKATKDSGDDPSDDIELAYEAISNSFEKAEKTQKLLELYKERHIMTLDILNRRITPEEADTKLYNLTLEIGILEEQLKKQQ